MLVEDIGPPDAKILICGEAPGREEETKGEPFCGPSGKLLKQMLSHSGIEYHKCYVTNIANERPPSNQFAHFYEAKNRKVPSRRLSAFWTILREKIEAIKPNIVIALGAEPLRAITNERGVDTWRGTLLSYKGTKVICTYHPAAVLRNYGFHPIAEMDFAKAKRKSEYSENRAVPPAILIEPTKEHVLSWLNDMVGQDRVAFDIETIGKNVRCIAIAKGSGDAINAICIPFIKFKSSSMVAPDKGNRIIRIGTHSPYASSYWSVKDEVEILDKISELLQNKAIQKVGQNSIAFDAPLLFDELGLEVENHFIDTMHSWHVLYPELPMSLNFLVSILTDYPNYWTRKRTDDDRSEWTYNAMDAAATLVISYRIEDELRASNLWKFYETHVHELAFATSEAQQVGVLIDKDARDVSRKKQQEKLDRLHSEINKIAGRDVNPNSFPQVSRLLYDDMKLPRMYKDGKLTTNEEALRKLEKKYPNEPALVKIIECRKAVKLIGTYLNAKLDEDGRMRTSYNVSGTVTGRISSSKTIWGTGLDLQNIPVGKSRGVENIRHLFIAGEGNVFIKGDLSQADTRATAEIILRDTGDATLHDLYRNPDFDIHTWMASKIFNLVESKIDKYQRDVGKLSNHSGNYGAGPNVLMAKATKDGIKGINYQFAKKMIVVRHAAIPGLRKWWRCVERKLEGTRTITTCLGRRRIFFGRLDDSSVLREAYAFEPQSVASGDVCNIIFRRLHKSLKSGCFPILQVFDEVVVECPEADIDYAVAEMRKAAIIPLFINEVPLLIPIDISVGKNWRDMSPYD